MSLMPAVWYNVLFRKQWLYSGKALKELEKLRDQQVIKQQNEDIARGSKQQNCSPSISRQLLGKPKPHIQFKRGRWQMDGWYSGNLPQIAYCHADWKAAREYFRSVLRCR